MRRSSILTVIVISMIIGFLCLMNIKSKIPTLTYSSISYKKGLGYGVGSSFLLFHDQYKNNEVASPKKIEVIQSHSQQVKHENKTRLGDSPRIIVLWTTWRSGSTYFGNLLSNIKPDTFYSYEPLHWWEPKILHHNNTVQFEAMTYLQDILRCRMLPKYKTQIEYMGRQGFYLDANMYLKKRCQPRKQCGKPDVVSKVCQKSDLHVAKVLRLPLKSAKFLLDDKNLDIKIVYLVRDPRAVLASRKKLGWCIDPSCIDPKVVCKLVEDDLEESLMLQNNYPEKFKMIQYEMANKNPKASLMDIMSFLDLPVSKKQLKLLSPVKLNIDSITSTAKNASLMVERWRMKNSFSYIKVYQESCVKPLSKLGLRIFESEKEFKNMSLPLLLPGSQ